MKSVGINLSTEEWRHKILKHCEFLEVKTRVPGIEVNFLDQSLKSDREEPSRLGIIVSRKFGNAVKRNWAKEKFQSFLDTICRCFVREADMSFFLEHLAWT